MSPQDKAKKPYVAPGFRIVDKDTAKALLERKATPGDPGVQAMLSLTGESESTSASSDLKRVDTPRHKP
jgi:hypothetical protein